MRHIAWIWLAVSSLWLGPPSARAETRPHYGGTLHVTVRAAPSSLDSADSSVPDSFAQRTVSWLLFDRLVNIDQSGRVQPGLAESWQSTRGNQRWNFRLRHGVKFHDGTPLTAEAVAASLRYGNPSWSASANGDSVIIEHETGDAEMLGELALARNGIVKRDSETITGTGPFHIADWQRGKKLTLAANDDYWGGRPFLDSVEIEMGKSFRDQMTSLELGKADLVEVAPEQTHRVSQQGRTLTSSPPIELLAVVFAREASSADEKTLREALSWSIDRGSMRSVLLQGAGQPTGSLLPVWMSGYGFVFPSEADLVKARQLRSQVRSAPTWTIGYDGNDPLARLLVERIALNARDAGLSLQPTSSATADLRLARIPLASSDPWIALEQIATEAGLPAAKNKGGSAEDLYAAEQAALAAERVISLFHLPVSYAAASTVKNWALHMDGSVDLVDAWLENTKP